MQTIDNLTGVFFGRTLVQQRGEIGGAKSVFVKMQGQKNELVFFPYGGVVKNPPKGAFKFYAGDLIEYRTNDDGLKPEIYLLKTYKVKSGSGTTVKIYRDGYKHIPFVGDVLMKAPEEIGGTGAEAYDITKVVATKDGGDNVWELTFSTAMGTLTEGDVLVEAESNSATGTMLVKNINGVAPYDYDFLYAPTSDGSDDDFDAARYFLVPAAGGEMFKNKMSPIPPCVEKLNESNVNGWFKIQH